MVDHYGTQLLKLIHYQFGQMKKYNKKCFNFFGKIKARYIVK